MQARVRVTTMIAMAVMVAGCDRVVDITLPDGPVQLVVEGRVEAVHGSVSGHQEVLLSTSAPYFSNQAAPPARGARVMIADGTGRNVVLQESTTQPGLYRTDDLVGVVGSAYTLRIHWQGDDYEAVDTLLAVPPIDSMYFAPRKNTGFDPGSGSGKPGPRATIDTRDQAGVPNYYLWDMYVDGKRIVEVDSAEWARPIDSDQLYDGLPLLAFQSHPNVALSSGQMVRVRQQSLTAQSYRYFRNLNDQLDGDGSPFSMPPNPVRGNVANKTRPDARALGYFIATHVSERSMRVP